MQKVLAYRYSQEVDGQRKDKEEVEILDSKTENGVTTYIVKTQDGITCTAIYNIFSNSYYADDIYGIIEKAPPSEENKRVFVLLNSYSIDGERNVSIRVLPSRVSAQIAMKEEIDSAKLDAPWWDEEKEKYEDDWEVVEYDDSFEVYQDGYYDSYNESWNIFECVMEKDLSQTQKQIEM